MPRSAGQGAAARTHAHTSWSRIYYVYLLRSSKTHSRDPKRLFYKGEVYLLLEPLMDTQSFHSCHRPGLSSLPREPWARLSLPLRGWNRHLCLQRKGAMLLTVVAEVVH